MYYFASIPTPPLTPSNNPVEVTLGLEAGRLDYFDVEMPIGCEGLAHLIIKFHNRQIVPYNTASDLFGDDRIFRIVLNYYMTEEPYEVKILAWNDDDTYLHTPTVGASVNDLKSVSVGQVLTGGV